MLSAVEHLQLQCSALISSRRHCQHVWHTVLSRRSTSGPHFAVQRCLDRAWGLSRHGCLLGDGVNDMYIERGARGQISAAFLDEQFAGQEWLPIGGRALQLFLAVVPRLGATALESTDCRQPNLTHLASAREDSSAASMKRTPSTPSSTPGTRPVAGLGEYPSRCAAIRSARSA
jgi:hypothetical protein